VDAKQVVAAVQAEDARGKAAGLFEDRLLLTAAVGDRTHLVQSKIKSRLLGTCVLTMRGPNGEG
jgi:hypothetical protein